MIFSLSVQQMDAPPPPLPLAHPADLVRAHQKDDFCQGLLRQQICETLEEVVGPRRAAGWQAHAALVSDMLYSVTTALLSGRTLGEEYCDLLCVAPDGSSVTRLGLASPSRRAAAVFIDVLPRLAPSVAASVAAAVSAAFAAFGSRGQRLRVLGRQSWAVITDASLRAVPLCLRLHLAAFYIFGSYRHVSERCAGLRQVSLSDRPYRNFSYRPLGVLLAAQVIGEVCSRCLQWRRSRADPAKDEALAAQAVAAMTRVLGNAKVDPCAVATRTMERQPICRICMCSCDCATSTPCGHLFCWDCIASWCAMKPSCPLCRTSAPPQQLLPLSHYVAPPAGEAR